MPTYSQLKKSVQATGPCPACGKRLPLFLFSIDGGVVARSPRPAHDGEERPVRKDVTWSKEAFCSFSCLNRKPLVHQTVWKVLRNRSGTNHEVSRHPTPEAANLAAERYRHYSDDLFEVKKG